MARTLAEAYVKILPDFSGFGTRVRERTGRENPTIKVKVEPDRRSLDSAAARIRKITTLSAAGGTGLTLLASGAASATSAVSGLAAALAPAAGTLLALPAVYGAAGAAAGTFRLGVLGVSEALEAGAEGDAEAYAEALAKIAPNARSTVRELIALKEEITDLPVQTRLFAGLGQEVKLLGRSYMPELRRELPQIAGGMNSFARGLADGARQAPAIRGVRDILQSTSASLGIASTNSDLLASTLGRLLSTGAPLLLDMAEGADRLVVRFSRWVEIRSETGELNEMLADGIGVLKTLGDVAGNVGGILFDVMSASNESGSGLLVTLSDLTGEVRAFTSSAEGAQTFTTIFRTLDAVGDQVGRSLGVVLPALADGVERVAPVIPPLAEGAGDLIVALAPLIPVAGEVGASVGGVMLNALEAVTPLVRTLAEAAAENEDVTVALATALVIASVAHKGYAVAAGISTRANTAFATSTTAAGVAANRLTTMLGKAGVVGAIATAGVAIGDMIGSAQTASVEINALADSFATASREGELGAAGLELYSSKGLFGLGNEAENTGKALDNFAARAFNALDQGWNARLTRMQSMGSAQSKWRETIEQTDAALAQMVRSGNLSGAATMQTRLVDAMVNAGVPLSVAIKQFPEYSRAVENATPPTEDLTTSMEEQEAAADDMRGTLDKLLGRYQSLPEANARVEEAIDALTGSVTSADRAFVRQNGTLDIGEQRGRDLQRRIIEMITANRDVAEATLRTTGSSDKANASWNRGINTLIEHLRRMGFSREEARKLAIQYGGVPDLIKTEVKTPGLVAAREGVRTFGTEIQGVQGKKIVIGVEYSGPAGILARNYGGYGQGLGVLKRATGGLVYGPGSETSDSIPAMLSRNEYVVKAASVKKIGIENLDVMNETGAVPGFARGGSVNRTLNAVGAARVPGDLSRLQNGIDYYAGTLAHTAWDMAREATTAALHTGAGGGIQGGGGGSQSKLVGFGRWLQRQGYRVSEHPAFGGVEPVHTRGSKHYSGRAIDVNKGAGTSRAEQRALAAILPRAHALGLRSIFMAPGHYNHAHFDYDDGGWLQHGDTGRNLSGKPEPVFTAQQWETLKANVGGGGNVTVVVQNHGVIASQAEAEDWLAGALRNLKRKGRV